MHTMNILRVLKKVKTIDPAILGAIRAFMLIVLTGTFFYALVEKWPISDALYFSVITLTTVGYGDMHPTSLLSKMFTMLYVLIGVGLVFHIVTSVARHMFDDERREIHELEQAVRQLKARLERKEPSL